MGSFSENLYICHSKAKINKQNNKNIFRNMKKLLIATLALVMGLTACNNAPKAENAEAAEATTTTTTTGKIAVYFVDQVVAQYQMAIDKQAAFQKEYEAKTKDLNASARKLEKDFNALQDKVNKVLITRADAEKEAAKIQERQAALQARSEKASAELAEKEQVMTNQIFNAIFEYVNALNAEGEYDIILASQTGAPVVSVKPELDLTQQIIEGLNKAYTPEKTK